MLGRAQDLAEMGREPRLLGIKGKTSKPTGFWRAKVGMNFHKNRYKYSGLGRHYFGDSSSPSDVSICDYSSGILLNNFK